MCGGYPGGISNNWLSSCEINTAGTDIWSSMTSLPGERVGVRGLTMNNGVLMIGNNRSSFYLCMILQCQEVGLEYTIMIFLSWTLLLRNGGLLIIFMKQEVSMQCLL